MVDFRKMLDDDRFKKYLELQAARMTLLDAIAYVQTPIKNQIQTMNVRRDRTFTLRTLRSLYTDLVIDLEKLKSGGTK